MSSKRRVRRKQCGTKIKYATQAEAEAHQHGGLRPYRCDYCGKFHLGHTPAKVRKATGDGWGA
jgi:hypothetical protein